MSQTSPQIAETPVAPSRYQYSRLSKSDSIRILTLDPGLKSDVLRGTLDVVPVDHAGNYEALSYVWGPPAPPGSVREIMLRNGDSEAALTLIGDAIFAALQGVRLTDRPRRIWADQCCINQGDEAERGQQVQFMNRIYMNAAHVLVWLGLDTEQEAISTFSFVYNLDEILRKCPADNESLHSWTLSLEEYVERNQKVLHTLTDRPWFKRGWIVQEVGTDTPATIFWGDATIDWDLLVSVCERLKTFDHLRKTLDIATSEISFLYRRFVEPDDTTHHANRFNFVYELQRSRHLHFTDDRDRIFAFLGHFSVNSEHSLSCGPVSIGADYTRTIQQTYIDVATKISRQRPAAMGIVLAAVQHSHYALPSQGGEPAENERSLKAWLHDETKLPSWVPDWRHSEGILLAEPISPHNAHGNSKTMIEIGDGNKLMLRVKGMKIDTIKLHSQPLLYKDLYGGKMAAYPATLIEWLWHEICEKQRFDLDEKYPNGQTAFFAFMQTLGNGCVQAAGYSDRQYHDIPDVEWLQKAAEYLVDTLGTSDKVSDELSGTVVGMAPTGDNDRWSRLAATAMDGRVFARTKADRYVLGPVALEAGDVVCLLFGSKVPFCLRPVGSRYILVGECYVHGLMKGEAMDPLNRVDFHEATFEIM